MQQWMAIALSLATAVHTVFGCCVHHAHGSAAYPALAGDVADSASCRVPTHDSHDHEHAPGDSHCPSPCQEKQCVSVLTDRPAPAELLRGTSCEWISGPRAAEAGGSQHEAVDAERLLFFLPARPVRTHLWFQILLI